MKSRDQLMDRAEDIADQVRNWSLELIQLAAFAGPSPKTPA